MPKTLSHAWRTLCLMLGLGLGLGMANLVMAQTMGAHCYAKSCRAQDATAVGGSSFGHYSGAGYASNNGGTCVGDGCQGGNGKMWGGDCYGTACKAGDARNTGGNCVGEACHAGYGNRLGGNCYGHGCKAGDAKHRGGNCYGKDCTPGTGGTRNGRAIVNHSDTTLNVACVLGEIYQSKNTQLRTLSNWSTPPGTACKAIDIRDRAGKVSRVEIAPVAAPSSAPAAVVIAPLPADPFDTYDPDDPIKLPQCLFSCQRYNPASSSCVGAPMNTC